MKLIAITGGIGSGKSVVAHMVQVMGFHVYDCDSRAKALMTESTDVRQQLTEAFGEQTYLADGTLNRQHLSEVAFSDSQALARLNAIVHPATANDMMDWAAHRRAAGDSVAFVETALLRTAELDRLMDEVWHVTAPDDVRVARVMTRSGLTAHQVGERMASQKTEDSIASGEQVVINDNVSPLLPQITKLIKTYNTNN